MATRTALGTAKLKASGTTLQLASQSLNQGDFLAVAVGFQQQSLPSSVKWGNRDLSKSASQINSTSGHGTGIWVLRTVANTDTRNIDVTWGSAIGARVLYALKIDANYIRDQVATAIATASTTPSAGPTSALTEFNEFALVAACSRGPSSDTAPTATGWTAGQRDGTVGAPPVSNITLAEFYQWPTDKTALTFSGTGATSSDWAVCLATFRDIIEAPVLDKFGSEIVAGDTVEYKGSTFTVSSVISYREAVLLSDGNQVHAYETEVKN